MRGERIERSNWGKDEIGGTMLVRHVEGGDEDIYRAAEVGAGVVGVLAWSH